jgi:hypothetical protein
MEKSTLSEAASLDISQTFNYFITIFQLNPGSSNDQSLRSCSQLCHLTNFSQAAGLLKMIGTVVIQLGVLENQ